MDVVHGLGELDVPDRIGSNSRISAARGAAVHQALHPGELEAIHDRVSIQILDVRNHGRESGWNAVRTGGIDGRWPARRRGDRPRRRRTASPCYCFASAGPFFRPFETGESPTIAGPLTTLP